MRRADEIERLVKETSFNASEATDKTLRASIAQANSDGSAMLTLERRQTRRLIMRISITRAALALMVCGAVVAAAVGGMKLYRYHFQGQDADGSYIFTTEPEVIHESVAEDPNGSTTHSITTRQMTVAMRPESPEDTSVEQMQTDLEEIDQLRQQGVRRLIRSIDSETENGPIRVNVYEYTLSDGRTITMAENERGQD